MLKYMALAILALAMLTRLVRGAAAFMRALTGLVNDTAAFVRSFDQIRNAIRKRGTRRGASARKRLMKAEGKPKSKVARAKRTG